jgi:hypothetical protein
MSARTRIVLDEFRKLSASEQQELLHELLRLTAAIESSSANLFPTVKLEGGTITSQQVAEALEDE